MPGQTFPKHRDRRQAALNASIEQILRSKPIHGAVQRVVLAQRRAHGLECLGGRARRPYDDAEPARASARTTSDILFLQRRTKLSLVVSMANTYGSCLVVLATYDGQQRSNDVPDCGTSAEHLNAAARAIGGYTRFVNRNACAHAEDHCAAFRVLASRVARRNSCTSPASRPTCESSWVRPVLRRCFEIK